MGCAWRTSGGDSTAFLAVRERERLTLAGTAQAVTAIDRDADPADAGVSEGHGWEGFSPWSIGYHRSLGRPTEWRGGHGG